MFPRVCNGFGGKEDYLDDLAALRPPVKPVLLAGGTRTTTRAPPSRRSAATAPFDRWQPDDTWAGGPAPSPARCASWSWRAGTACRSSPHRGGVPWSLHVT